MADYPSYMPQGEHPLLARVHRPDRDKQRQELTLPELHLVVGRDLRSSGVTISVWEPTAGQWPAYRHLYAARWLEPVLTPEGALRIAANSAAAAVAELFGPATPA
jgi:hypothetical protein